MNLIFASRLLKDLYLELINDILQGKELPTAEELALETIEKLDPYRKIWKIKKFLL